MIVEKVTIFKFGHQNKPRTTFLTFKNNAKK